MGAGDDQHGHHPDHGLVGVTEGDPGDEGHRRGRGGHGEEQGRGPVGQDLGPRAGGLGLGHQPLDARQGGLLPDGVDAQAHGRVGGDRAGHDPVPGGAGDGPGLPGDHRLVELGGPLGDLTVGGRPAPGSDQHHVAPPQGVDGNGLDLAVGPDPVGLIREQGGQGRQGVLGLAQGLHLLPVAQQHDRDQRSQLPPEVQVEPVEAGRQRRAVGHRDRHGDQEHHPRLAGLDLGPPTGQEGPAAPEEDDRAEDRPDPLDPGEVDRVAEPVHDHGAGQDHGHRQQQRPPEPAPEHLDVVAVVAVVRMTQGVLVTLVLDVSQLLDHDDLLARFIYTLGGYPGRVNPQSPEAESRRALGRLTPISRWGTGCHRSDSEGSATLRRTTFFIAVALAAALFLTACGDDTDHGSDHMGDGPSDDMSQGGMTGMSDDMGHDEASPVTPGALRIEITARSFAFDPEDITVAAGEDIAIVSRSADTLHDVTIDELDAHVAVDAGDTGDTGEGGFRADGPGTYTYYCSVPRHRDEGVEGTLVVE